MAEFGAPNFDIERIYEQYAEVLSHKESFRKRLESKQRFKELGR